MKTLATPTTNQLIREILSNVPMALLFNSRRGHKKWYLFEGETELGEDTRMVPLTDEQLRRLQQYINEDAEELPVDELLEKVGDDELRDLIEEKEDDAGCRSFYAHRLVSADPTNYYRFTVSLFMSPASDPQTYSLLVPMSEQQYAQLVAAVYTMNKNYFTFNLLEEVLPELHAYITHRIACNAEVDVYPYTFAVWAEEAIEDAKALEAFLTKETDCCDDGYERINFYGDVMRTQISEYFAGRYDIDSFVYSLDSSNDPTLGLADIYRGIIEQAAEQYAEQDSSLTQIENELFEHLQLL